MEARMMERDANRIGAGPKGKGDYCTSTDAESKTNQLKLESVNLDAKADSKCSGDYKYVISED